MVNLDFKSAVIESWTEEAKKKLWKIWNDFALRCDVPLIDLINKAIDKLAVDGVITLTPARDRSYFVELFGRFGFGTGGFRPLNNVTFTEIARLLIWNYSDEYLIPNDKNADFAKQLYDNAKTKINNTTNSKLTEKPGTKALFVGERVSASAYTGIDVMSINASSNVVNTDTFDYVFLATSHHAAQRILEPYASLENEDLDQGTPRKNIPSNSSLQFEFEGSVINYKTPQAYSTPFDKVKGSAGNWHAGMKGLHMMRSTKYFTDVTKAHYDQYCPKPSPDNLKNEIGPIKMVISDTDFATSYFLPTNGANGTNGKINALISYTWGDEASNEAPQLHNLTKTAGSNQNAILAPRHAEVSARLGTEHASPNAGPINGLFWLNSMLQKLPADDKGYMYNWSADRDSRGGFKLDWAGETDICIKLCNHYKTSNSPIQLATPVTKQHLFIAGDSMSHLGGWLEGAFMSSIAAFSGMLVSLTGNTTTALSSSGQNLHKYPDASGG